jgi:hypothetical protein
MQLREVFVKSYTHFRPLANRSPNALARTKIPMGENDSIGTQNYNSAYPHYHKPRLVRQNR